MAREHRKKKRSKVVLLALILLLLIGGCFIVQKLIPLKPKAKLEKVTIKKMPNGHFQLLVGKEPFLIKGVCYQPIPIGEDYSYNFWGDPAKPWLVDGKLMKEAGINTVRFYEAGNNPQEVKQILGDLYKEFGVRTIMGNTLGVYDSPPVSYADPYCLEALKKEVLNMVKEYKDEPGILMWLLGNENNYSFNDQISPWGSEELDKIEDFEERANQKARIYYSFVNELAKEIHKIDPNHPVGFGNGEVFYLEIAKEVMPDVDFLGGIFYRGISFGNIWQQIDAKLGKPVVLIEFGSDRFNAKTGKEDEDIQAKFLASQWKEILRNSCGQTGKGIVLGGCIFEWSDEWWKHDSGNPVSWLVHDEAASWSNGAYYFDIEAEGHMNMNEEWYGIVGLSPEKENGINKRVPKKAYYVLKEIWAKGCEILTTQKGVKANGAETPTF